MILEDEPEAAGVDLSLLEPHQPDWLENIILYGQYVLSKTAWLNLTTLS